MFKTTTATLSILELLLQSTWATAVCRALLWWCLRSPIWSISLFIEIECWFLNTNTHDTMRVNKVTKPWFATHYHMTRRCPCIFTSICCYGLSSLYHFTSIWWRRHYRYMAFTEYISTRQALSFLHGNLRTIQHATHYCTNPCMCIDKRLLYDPVGTFCEYYISASAFRYM